MQLCICIHLDARMRGCVTQGVLGLRMLQPLSPPSAVGEGSQSGPAGTAPTDRLFLSYHSLASLILALAQREGQVCDGDAVLLLSNHFTISCHMEHSVGSFSSTAARLPSST